MSVQEVSPPATLTGDDSATFPRPNTSPVAYAPWAIAGAAAAWILVPLLNEYRAQLWSAEHYRFFPLLLGAVGWLAWRRSQTADPFVAHRIEWLRIGLWCFAVAATACAGLAASPFGAAVSLLLIAIAGLYEWRGTWALRTFLPVVAVLLLILRPPFNWDQKLIVAMQRSATAWASGVLDLAGIRHVADGVAIRLPERDVFVDEACSGVHSLFATLAFVAVFAAAARRGVVKSALLFVAAIFWVLVANILRVLAVVVLSTRYDLPVIDGAGHEILGVLVFAFVIALVLSTDRLLLFLFGQPEPMLAVPAAATKSDSLWARRVGGVRQGALPIAVAALLVLTAVGIGILPANATPIADSPFASGEGLVPVAQDALPAEWNGWRQVGFQVREREKDDPEGEISRIWTYQKGRIAAAISIDGPFDQWHDTEVCYQGLGYTTQSCEDIKVQTGSAVPAEYTELSISGESGQHGYVLFMAYNTNGEALHPPISRNASVARLVSAWRQRVAGEAPPAVHAGRVFQVQLFTENRLNFTAAEREEMTQLFHHMRREIARSSTASKEDASAEGGST